MKSETYQFANVENESLRNISNEALNSMEFHEVSELHAMALINNNKPVFSLLNGKIKRIYSILNIEKFYID